MSQPFDFDLPTGGTVSPDSIIAQIQELLDALKSSHIGANLPNYKVAGLFYVRNAVSPWEWKFYDGTDAITIGEIDPVSNLFKMHGLVRAEDGAANAASISFDADPDTGLFRPAADTLGVAAGGAERFRFGTALNRSAVNLAAGDLSTTGATYGAQLYSGIGRMATSVTVTTSLQHWIGYNPNGAVGSISTSGSTTSFNTSSDHRLKIDVEPLVDFEIDAEQFAFMPDALLRLLALRPVSFRWTTDPDAGLTHGFLAHEAQAVVPHAVIGAKDAEEDVGTITIPAVRETDRSGMERTVTAEQQIRDRPQAEAPGGATWEKTGTAPVYQQIDHSKIVPDLVAGVQALAKLVLDQQARIAALEAA